MAMGQGDRHPSQFVHICRSCGLSVIHDRLPWGGYGPGETKYSQVEIDAL